MSSLLRNRGNELKKESIAVFCERGMNEYTSSIFKAFHNNDWSLLEEMSMKYEADCYNIGAIEIVGKLIKLRLQLQAKPVDKYIIESTLNIILDHSSKAQEFLIEQLRKSDYPIVYSRLIYVSKPPDESGQERRDWFYNNCFIQ